MSRRPRRRRAAVAIAVAVGLSLAAACGITADDEPQAIATEDLPADLLDPNPVGSTTLPESAGTTTVPIYLLEETPEGVQLVAVDREVTQAGIPNERLAALFGGTTESETDAGITSGIPADAVLLEVTTDEDADEVLVNLTDEFFSVEGPALAHAFAQIVFTATEEGAGGYSQVRFLVDGEPTRVLDDEGFELDGAVTRADYMNLDPD